MDNEEQTGRYGLTDNQPAHTPLANDTTFQQPPQQNPISAPLSPQQDSFPPQPFQQNPIPPSPTNNINQLVSPKRSKKTFLLIGITLALAAIFFCIFFLPSLTDQTITCRQGTLAIGQEDATITIEYVGDELAMIDIVVRNEFANEAEARRFVAQADKSWDHSIEGKIVTSNTYSTGKNAGDWAITKASARAYMKNEGFTCD